MYGAILLYYTPEWRKMQKRLVHLSFSRIVRYNVSMRAGSEVCEEK